MSFSKDMIQSIPYYLPGSMPTAIPAEYSIRLSNNEVNSIDSTQPQILVSHSEDFSLWKEKDNVTHAFKKFVMTGRTKEIKNDLSDAFAKGMVTDFLVTNEIINYQEPFEDHLVLQYDNPFVTFAARIGNTSSLLFTGISAVKFCTSGNDDGSIGCDVWYESVLSPLYLYTIDTNGLIDENLISNNETIIGFINFDYIHHDAKITDTIVDHKVRKGNKKLSIMIILLLATIALFLIFKMWTSKRQDYQTLDE